MKSDLQIIEPTVAPGLDTSRIAVMQPNKHVDYYMGVKWAAPVSEMLRSVLVDSFERSNMFASVSTDRDTIHTDMVLITDLRDYEVTNNTNGEVHIRLVAKLVSSKDRKVLATIPVERTVKPEIYKMDAIVSTFNSVSADIANEIVNKSVSSLPACQSKSKPHN